MLCEEIVTTLLLQQPSASSASSAASADSEVQYLALVRRCQSQSKRWSIALHNLCINLHFECPPLRKNSVSLPCVSPSPSPIDFGSPAPPPEILRDQTHLSATDRLALILRLRDPSFLAEHLASHLRDFTQCEQLILVLQKVLYGNLARQAQSAVAEDGAAVANGGANLPACARGLRYGINTGVGCTCTRSRNDD